MHTNHSLNVVTMQTQRTESLSHEEPLRLTDIKAISRICGNAKLVDQTLVRTCNRYGLMQWPRDNAAAIKAETWTACLERSTTLRRRLVYTDERELRNMFGVGSLTNNDPLIPEQVRVRENMHQS